MWYVVSTQCIKDKESRTVRLHLEIIFIQNWYIIVWMIYTPGWNVWGEWFLAVNHHNHRNWVPSILIYNLSLIFIGMKQKKIVFWKKNQNAFFKIANSQYLLWEFHGLVLGLVELMGLNLCCHELKNISSKTGKNAFFGFLGLFWAYVGQPHDHIA